MEPAVGRSRQNSIPGRGNCKCKGLRVGRTLVYSRNFRQNNRAQAWEQSQEMAAGSVRMHWKAGEGL